MVGDAEGKDAGTLNSFRNASHELVGRVTGGPAWAARRGAMVRAVFAVFGWFAIASLALADIQMPVADSAAPISVRGEGALRWKEGLAEVWVVRRCTLQQDQVTAWGDQAVLWVIRESPGTGQASSVMAYLEGSVGIDFGRDGKTNAGTGRAAQSIRDHSWFGRMRTSGAIDVRVPVEGEDPDEKPFIYSRAKRAWDTANGPVRKAQFSAEVIGPPPLAPVAGANKRVQVGPRSSTLIHIKSYPGSVPNQSVTLFSNGIRAVIEGLQAPSLGNIGRIVIETDRLVLWGPNLKSLSPSGSETQGGAGIPIELYMEGNIVFRQGDRLIYADRMYYNATHEYGVVLTAEMITPIPQYQGMMRLKADVLQQMDRQNFKAFGAAITSSQMGVPQYWLQGQTITFRDIQNPRVNPITGQLDYDPRTREGAVDHDLLATSRNNFLYVGGFPVMYWPVMASNLRKPTFYIDEFSIRNDNIFGTQVRTKWDAFQIFGRQNPPDGVAWTISTDALWERGLGIGTPVEYNRLGFLTFPGPARGMFDAWGIRDKGLDDLGADRRALTPEQKYRGRALWWHRQDLPQGFQFTAQLGFISDRNFLEQYYEREWDQWKTQETSVELKHTHEEQSLRLLAGVRINDFFTQSEWLPRLDHFLIGRSLLQDRLTWFAHSQASYTRLRIATAPEDPVDAAGWHLLPWEQKVEGARAITRQEIDLPLQWGPLKLVPYAAGELGYWGQVLNGDKDVSRASGQAGVRLSLPIWKPKPTVHNALFNLNGMAHKITLLSDFFWADASQDLGRFPLYDRADDDSQLHFRRRLPTVARYDERSYLFRSGMQGWVTSPTAEIADDLTAIRTGIHQRWQTKRGLPGQQRVVDWIILDLDATVFPNADRDNFGESVGQVEYDFRWHIGDRLTLLSDGYADPFPGGFRRLSIGGAISRPRRGRLYAGFITMDGPFTSDLFVTTLSYRMSPKWLAELAATYDFGPTGQIGERFAIVRIGESALIRIGGYADHSRNNVGISFSIEPRFLPHSRLGRVAGVQIPPAGFETLE